MNGNFFRNIKNTLYFFIAWSPFITLVNYNKPRNLSKPDSGKVSRVGSRWQGLGN